MELAICLIAVFVGVFMILQYLGPPRSMYCDRSMNKHEFGPWEIRGYNYQRRQCKKCGWTETLNA